MKKILLCTTALLAASSVFAAEGVNVTFEGQSKFEAATVSQDKTHQKYITASQKRSAFFTSQKASLKAEGKSDSLTYGAVMRLQVIGNGTDGMSDARNSRSHIYMDTDAGSVHLGSNFGASKLMQVDAGKIASGTGGIDGDFSKFVNTKLANVFSDVNTLANQMDANGESARKITYMSPRISGVQLGVSFAPDMNNVGDQTALDNVATVNGEPNKYVKNLWSAGLSFKHDMNGVVLDLAAVADKGNATVQNKINGVTTELNDLQTFSVGGTVATNGFSFAASYHNNGKSLQAKTTGSKYKSYFWTLGAAYENGPMSTSLTYLQGEQGGDKARTKTQIVSLGADYEVAAGLKPFAEVTMVTNKFDDKSAKAKATVFLLGTKVKF
jgi:hypothetical protein